MIRKIFLSLTLLFYWPNFHLQSDDFYSEYWQQLYWRMWESNIVALGTYVRVETGNHFKNIRSLHLSEQLLWKLSENFSVEVHYTYITGHSVVENSSWRWRHRFELEGNRIFRPFFCNCLIKTRNRLEIVKIKNKSKFLWRLRQKTMLAVPVENRSILKTFSLYNELFYNATTNIFTEDRLCPCQLTFALSDKVNLDLFFLIRFFNDDIWRKSAVLGTQLSF